MLVFFVKANNTQLMLDTRSLSTHSYIPKRDSKKWDSSNPKGYYLFTKDDQSIEITTFQGKIVFKSKYTFIGNGVYELSDSKGYIVAKNKGLDIYLKERNPLIFESYITFDK
ncbi:hypothetical protein RU96_GL000032 [Enterococcus canintestini]|nr:hypothetical protein RU96_GL000032 [Enterococcus canintestini]